MKSSIIRQFGFFGVLKMYEIVPIVIFLIILLYISIEDIKFRLIPYWTVPVLFFVAPIYIYLAELDFTKASFSFILVAGLFLFLYIVGKGSYFGIGDVMVMAVIGWALGNTANAYVYLIYCFAPTLFIWFIINAVYHIKKFGTKDFWKYRRIVKTKDLKPGMVLESDNFMHGMTPDKIKELQGKYDEVSVKQPYSFIPTTFISMVIYIIWLYCFV